jgi:hypothetical protein
MSPVEAMPLLVFQHIPKTAGISIRSFLWQLWPEGQVWPAEEGTAKKAHRARSYPWREPGFWRGLRGVAGHFPHGYDLIDHLPARPTLFASVLREPVARAISSYDYIRRTPKHHLYESLSRLSLLEALEQNEAFAAQMRCGQLRYVFGDARNEVVQLALTERSHLLGRMDALPAFVAALARFAGRAQDAPALPRKNTAADKPARLPPAMTQPDHRRAVALLREWNRAETAFLRRIDPLLLSRGLRREFPALAEALERTDA